MPLDGLFHADRVSFEVAAAMDRGFAPSRLDKHVREHHAGLDPHRGHVRHVNGLFAVAEPSGRVVDDARRRNQDLGGKEAVAGAQAAGAKDQARREGLALAPQDERGHESKRGERGENPLHSGRC